MYTETRKMYCTCTEILSSLSSFLCLLSLILSFSTFSLPFCLSHSISASRTCVLEPVSSYCEASLCHCQLPLKRLVNLLRPRLLHPNNKIPMPWLEWLLFKLFCVWEVCLPPIAFVMLMKWCCCCPCDYFKSLWNDFLCWSHLQTQSVQPGCFGIPLELMG